MPSGQGVFATSTGLAPLEIDANPFQVVQEITQNKGALSSAQEQALVGAVNQIVQTVELKPTTTETNSSTGP